MNPAAPRAGARIAVSSLAWKGEDDATARAVLERRGVRGLEVAPYNVWPSLDAALAAAPAYREWWRAAGIEVVALQGILFGHPLLRVFGTPAEQGALVSQLGAMAQLASVLGAGVLVFGAPRNRLRGALGEDEAFEAAAELFVRAAAAVREHGVVIGIEPNPARYGGDFVLDLAGAARLVEAVGSPLVQLHVDAGAIALAVESDDMVRTAARRAVHFHVSEVELAPVGAGTVDHARLGRLLGEAGYPGWRSVEMKPVPGAELDAALERAIDVAEAWYG